MEETPSIWKTTCWDLVSAASGARQPDFDEAWTRFVALYHAPLYACLRRWGRDSSEAAELVHDFLTRIFVKELLTKACPERGRLRDFLRTSLLNFHRDHHRSTSRSQQLFVSFETAEALHIADRCPDLTPEEYFDRRCGIALMDQAFALVRARVLNQAQFDELRGLILHDDPSRVKDVAGRLGLEPNAVHQCLSRWRNMWGMHLRSLVAESLGLEEGHPESETAITDEIRYLFRLSRSL